MRRLCEYYTTNKELWSDKTAVKFRGVVGRSKLTQRKIAQRIKMSHTRLNALLKGSPRYRWSEEIARRILAAIKQKK